MSSSPHSPPGGEDEKMNSPSSMSSLSETLDAAPLLLYSLPGVVAETSSPAAVADDDIYAGILEEGDQQENPDQSSALPLVDDDDLSSPWPSVLAAATVCSSLNSSRVTAAPPQDVLNPEPVATGVNWLLPGEKESPPKDETSDSAVVPVPSNIVSVSYCLLSFWFSLFELLLMIYLF